MAARTLNLLSLSSIPSQSDLRKSNGHCTSFNSQLDKSIRLSSSLIGTPLPIGFSNPNPISLKRKSTTMRVSFSLPTSRPEGDVIKELPKWSARAIKAFNMGVQEGRKIKYPETGTESLLMGILVEGTSHAAKFLRANGITFFKVRDETVNLLGKSDMFFTSPEYPPMTEFAQNAVDWAIDQKLKSGEGGEITVTHLLLGIWAQKESAAHRILTSLGFNDEKAKELLKYMDKDIVLTHK